MTTRVVYETKRARQSMAGNRLSRATSSASKRMSSLLRKKWDKTRLPPLTERQKALVYLVTETTINRIVEAAERELAERRERRRNTLEEQRRRRQEREAKEAELRVADAKDGKSRMLASQMADEARQRADSLTSRASKMRLSARERLSQILEFDQEDEIVPLHRRRLSTEDEHAIANAAPELRAFLRLPRHHTAGYFLLHPSQNHDELLRKTAFPAPERDWKRT
ncbi:unnamed protein product [Echinostoma caproni]|uniref:Uncharacterized protein n=1 Tax=Echinostoma caproni TaxID=27848 RepID=A0A183AHX2_9TREM|nr:unnamed protein product [Echinostoma caproni]